MLLRSGRRERRARLAVAVQSSSCLMLARRVACFALREVAEANDGKRGHLGLYQASADRVSHKTRRFVDIQFPHES